MGIVLPVPLREILPCRQGRNAVLVAQPQQAIAVLGWHRRGGGV